VVAPRRREIADRGAHRESPAPGVRNRGRADGRVTPAVCRDALELLQVDEHGFDEADRRLLRTIIDKFSGGPVGLSSLAAAIGEEKDAIEDINEPYLIQIGFLERTSRGRVATARAYEYFGLTAPGKERLW
jgi:Holliday junction DNA helicase RuvB